jgi:hypothetical protein
MTTNEDEHWHDEDDDAPPTPEQLIALSLAYIRDGSADIMDSINEGNLGKARHYVDDIQMHLNIVRGYVVAKMNETSNK